MNHFYALPTIDLVVRPDDVRRLGPLGDLSNERYVRGRARPRRRAR